MPVESDGLSWFPGSFTKNFRWGTDTPGLLQLYRSIRIGFDDKTDPVPRALFRERVKNEGLIDFIPMNFFLFTKKIGGVDHIIVDELVFKAVTSDHSEDFDRLAFVAFHLSFAGLWSGASKGQRRPALWAHYYIKDVINDQRAWDISGISANDIEKFVRSDSREF